MQAAFGLEPLAWEAQVDAACGDMDAAEGEIGGLPDLDAEVVRREDGSADVVGADIVDLPALHDRDRAALHPDVLADQRRGSAYLRIALLFGSGSKEFFNVSGTLYLSSLSYCSILSVFSSAYFESRPLERKKLA